MHRTVDQKEGVRVLGLEQDRAQRQARVLPLDTLCPNLQDSSKIPCVPRVRHHSATVTRVL
jgi:hypothetical protein